MPKYTPTSSFDKVVVLDKESAEKLLNSMEHDEPRKIETKWLTPEMEERGKRMLKRSKEFQNPLPAEIQEKLNYYMSLNYKIELIKDDEKGGYAASHPDLKGCMTCGEDLIDAVLNLEDAKREWIIAALEDGFPIPQPHNSIEKKE